MSAYLRITKVINHESDLNISCISSIDLRIFNIICVYHYISRWPEVKKFNAIIAAFVKLQQKVVLLSDMFSVLLSRFKGPRARHLRCWASSLSL